MKYCNKCEKEKPETEFWNAKLGKNGKDWYCIECRQIEAKKAREKSKQGLTDSTKGRNARKVQEGHRWCSIGQHEDLIEKFSKWERSCRECKKWSHLRRAYGLSKEEFGKVFKEQNGKCKICLTREIKYVDHDHKTGEVRGLLCPSCNTALGLFLENPEIFRRAMNYLKGE